MSLNSSHIDDDTPVLVGVGQVSDPIDGPNYHRWSAVDLAAEAARAALEDAGIPASAVDTVAGVRQFEISTPGAPAPVGRSVNYPRSVAERLGAAPRRAVLEVGGGQSPQHLVTEFAKAIARGEAGTVLLFGSEAISTTRSLAGRPDAPDFSEAPEGDLEDRGFGLEGLVDEQQFEHGLVGAPQSYALFENARRQRVGASRIQYAEQMGELFAPFTEVAARNPFAAAPTVRSVQELVTVTERNRMIADPYPRFVVARDQVNQGAAVLLTSVGAARAAGVPEDTWVFLHGYSDLREKNLLDRLDLSCSPASVLAARTALQRAGVEVDAVSTFDLYSCFPVAVLNICDGLGLSPTDPRGLTLTGGLPFFGGAGNNYSMHAIAETVARVRADPGSVGFVGANGGLLSKYSAGVYSSTPVAFVEHSDSSLQRELDAKPGPTIGSLSNDGGGAALTVETCTVLHDKRGRLGVIIGRLTDGSRVLATTVPDDERTVDLLVSENPFGAVLHAERHGQHTFAALKDPLAVGDRRTGGA